LFQRLVEALIAPISYTLAAYEHLVD